MGRERGHASATRQKPTGRVVLFDLDDTLIDRAAAFRLWIDRFADGLGLDARDRRWLIDADADGATPRRVLFDAARERFGLESSVEALVARYRAEYPDLVARPPTKTHEALTLLRREGWRLCIVTNGTRAQEAKIRRAGLDALVDGWVTSDAARAEKPQLEIFETAAALVGCTLRSAWMVGDGAQTDIAGASAAGIPSIWIHRGREWPARAFAPTATAADTFQAVETILASGGDYARSSSRRATADEIRSLASPFVRSPDVSMPS